MALKLMTTNPRMSMDWTLRTAAASGMGAVIGGRALDAAQALAVLADEPHLLCHSAFLIERLGVAAQAPRRVIRAAREQRHYDVAELFAFVCPARFATPTPTGLARALALEPGADESETLRLIAEDLLNRLAARHYPLPRETAENANFLSGAKWPWAKSVLAALLKANPKLDAGSFATGLNAWDRVDEWEEDSGRAPGRQDPVTPSEASEFLAVILGPDAERRVAQAAYAGAASFAFQPRQSRDINNILLAEAGTGLGKTMGYLAPAWLWARKNNAPVWVSTYTKNLQRQIDQESARLVDNPEERAGKIAIRKGRENYVCLLNMQEAFGRLTSANPRMALLAALISRWARFTRDGDMVGGDFPAWMLPLFNDVSLDGEMRAVSVQSLSLTDRRGECIYAACPHYRRCFIERSVRAGRNAAIVIANHALVLHQAAVDNALGLAKTAEEEAAPGGLRRIVFDEGHHLFDAADQAFSGHLTALETAELRRWIRGPEAERRRGRGLADRIGDLLGEDAAGEALLRDVLRAALALPGPGWTRRVQAGQAEGVAEEFLSLVRQQVLARAAPNAGGHSLEADCLPLIEALDAVAVALGEALQALRKPMLALASMLARKLDDEAGDLNSHDRGRIEAISRSLRRRGELVVGGWIAMLERLLGERSPLFVEWFDIAQAFGREHDVGLHSHWLDPTEPLALAVLRPADGIIITSATLKDRPPDLPDDWVNAETRTGAVHLPYPVRRESWESPFDYARRSSVIVVTDVNREDMDQVAAAYRELFLASGGGALGLFTAISRLRAVHQRLIKPLADGGLPLYAQHVDPMDTGTLVDMFRAERDACLLGTDAVRDGVDVPGDSLRLIVLDRVPWATPTILERARRDAFGGAAYTDMAVRLRLRQGFGRLIRQAGDRGHFVILDPRLASRFLTAFPNGVSVRRLGLVDALDALRA
ncbi:ATP-dependent DNA helicase [Aestuariivirga sp.]|jgi:ATP-dependent DNA helicase DinG|uniref:ATP-dependent DNA helicase n=1 Tax=Aestuariivirga sp. TaxID=2650926 RepID=UPI0037848DD8